MNPFTILLLYPDYLATTFGHDTYMTSVQAPTVAAAITKAQADIAIEYNHRGHDVRLEDFHCLCAIAGDHPDIKP